MKKKKQAKSRHAVLSHKSLTGKKLSRHNTSYPVVIFMLLCLGVFLGGMTFKASAANISVNAIANGPPPPDPAIITSPIEGKHFKTVPITVKGSCPAGYVVKLYRNNLLSGTVLCGGANTFELQSDLFEGLNSLNARVFNFIDDEGPSSPSVNVYYDKPVTPQPSSGGTITQPPSSPTGTVKTPFLVTSDTSYQGYYTGDTIVWHIKVLGGTPPYAVSVNWGDGKTSVVSRKKAGLFDVSHVYEKAGGYRDSYAIKIDASDSAGNTSFLQLMTIVHDRAQLAAATIPSGTASASPLNIPLKFMWPLWGVTILMSLSFWLGEQHEFTRLSPRMKLHR